MHEQWEVQVKQAKGELSLGKRLKSVRARQSGEGSYKRAKRGESKGVRAMYLQDDQMR